MSEIEAFPRAVLKHHYEDVPLHGDFTTIEAGQYDPIDLLVGGTPCQPFSIAGLRGGLDDDRGNLALEYLRLAGRLRPRWLVWENVPGVLSSNGGRDFGSILGGMGELGYGVAYRVLDAQFFGVAQRRRRVFAVGYLGDWRRAAAVLFERDSLSGNPPPRREKREGTALSPSLRARANSSHRADSQAYIPDIGYALNAHGGAHGRQDAESETLIAHALRGEGFDASEDGTGRGTPIVPVCFSAKDHGADAIEDLSPTLRAGGHSGSHANAGVMPAIAYSIMPQNSGKDYKARPVDVAQPIMAAGPAGPAGGNQGGDYIVHAIQERAVSENPNAGPQGTGVQSDIAYTLEARNKVQAVSFALRGREGGAMPEIGGDQSGALRAASGGSSRDYVAFAHQAGGAQTTLGFDPAAGTVQTLGANQTPAIAGSAVRRLTPRECERLQGFPDDYTLIPWRKGNAPDGPRYKALGNSMAVPVMAWIGRRIAEVDKL